jgi:polyisoprenoid-binding protein YceI
MIRNLFAGLFLTLCLVVPAGADPVNQDPARVPAGSYRLDPRHASLIVRIGHLGGFSRFTLRFDRLAGGFTYDPVTWATTRAEITVDPRSVNTGLADFDKELAGPRYFAAERNPEIRFVTRQIEAVGSVGKITGDLTFMGQTRPVVLDVTFNGSGPGLLGAGTRLGFSGTTQLKRSDWGLTHLKSFTSDEIELVIEVEFVRT